MSAATAPIAVLGAGSWGTTLAKVLADAGNEVVVAARRPEIVTAINERHVNPDYLPRVPLPAGVRATGDATAAVRGADLVVLAVPSQTLRDNLADWAPHLRPDVTLVSLMKGIELGSGLRMSEVVVNVTGCADNQVAVMTGPNLAGEIAREQPTATVIASSEPERAGRVQRAVGTGYFRPYTNNDVIGCELAGAVKNVIALAFGMAAGLGLGDNTKTTLITRGLAETARLGARLSADPWTFAGLAGLGDLVASCYSPLARNSTFGEHLGRGQSLEQAQQAARQTVEGVYSCLAVRDLARRHGVEMPITEQVERVCHEGTPPGDAVRELMGRDHKAE